MSAEFWAGWLWGATAGVAWARFLGTVVRDVRAARAGRRRVAEKLARHG